MNVLICGDSFAADYTVKYKNVKGWPNMLAEKHTVTNIAQAGCSQYKIYKQLLSCDLNTYDIVIINHTSPFRIHVDHHPLYDNDPLHKNCDLLYTDIKEKSVKYKQLQSIVDFFENYFDTDYAIFVYNLLAKEIEILLKDVKVIHMCCISDSMYPFKNLINFSEVFAKHKGDVNHFNEMGNKIIFERLMKLI